MDKNKQRMISSMGGKASKSSRQHHPEKDEKDADRNDRKREGDAFQRDLSSLEDNDDLDTSERKPDSLNYSETDEDEDEGLGDGNLGRSTRGGVGE